MLRHLAPHTSRPLRLLVESDDPALAISDFRMFIDAGFDVTYCPGPGYGDRCPALDGEPCPHVEDADVVFNALGADDPRAAVARAVHQTSPSTAMVVAVCGAGGEDLPENCVPLNVTASTAGQIQALRRAALSARRMRG